MKLVYSLACAALAALAVACGSSEPARMEAGKAPATPAAPVQAASAAPAVPAPAAAQPAQPVTPTQVGEKMIDALARGDLAAATVDFDDTMKNALPAVKIKEIWDQLNAQFGPFQKRVASKVAKVQGYDAVFVNCQFANNPVTLQVTVDQNRKVSGFFIR